MKLRRLRIAGLRAGRGRRTIRLGRRPLLQLRLPLMLLGLTALFGVLFAAHTAAAWGALVEFGAAEQWVRMLAEEIVRDYLVVSAAMAGAYVTFFLIVCLAHMHRMLGPIVALERHLDRLHRGHYDARVRLRNGDPLARVAEDLNALGEMLREQRGGRAVPTVTAEAMAPATEAAARAA